MTFFDFFLWVVFPYISMTIFIVGHFYRYYKDQFGWTAKSSQFLEQKKLRFGSIVFHWGIIFVFFGHVAGLIVPKEFYDAIGITSDLYHLGAVSFGGLAGIATVIGGFFLFLRRVTVKRVKQNSSMSDFVTLIILGGVVVVGFAATAAYTATGGSFDYRVTIGPWIRGLLTFRPMPEYMAGAPIGFQLHVLGAFIFFAIWPFTRLVHVFSLPLHYLGRRYVVYRQAKPKKKTEFVQKKDI